MSCVFLSAYLTFSNLGCRLNDFNHADDFARACCIPSWETKSSRNSSTFPMKHREKKVEPPESSETYPLAILRACKSLLWYGLLSSIIYLWTMMILHSYVKLPKAIPHQLSCGPYPVSSVLPGLSIHGKVLHVLSSLPRKLSGPSNNHHVWVISPDIVSENIGQNPWNYAREEATRAINVTLLPAYPPVISHDYGNNHGPLCFDDFPLK